MARCDDMMVRCDGAMIRCDDMMVRCDGAMIRCDDMMVRCDGAMIRCDGRVRWCDGTVRYDILAYLGSEQIKPDMIFLMLDLNVLPF